MNGYSKCDSCKKDFKDNIKTKPEKIGNEKIKIGYMLCYHCDKKYLIWVKNEEIFDLEKEINKFKNMLKISKDNTNPNIKKTNSQIKKKQVIRKMLMEKLEKRFLEERGEHRKDIVFT